MPASLMETDHELLRDFWSAEEAFRGEHRHQFQNAFIGALSNLSDELVWKTALQTARNVVLRNVKAKAEHHAEIRDDR